MNHDFTFDLDHDLFIMNGNLDRTSVSADIGTTLTTSLEEPLASLSYVSFGFPDPNQL